MEGVSSAAKVVALVLRGLQSLKFVRDTVHKIRNGPEAVTKLMAVASDLSSVLQQVKILAEGCRGSRQDPKNRLLKDLIPALKMYTTELDEAQSKLQGFDSHQPVIPGSQ